MNNKTRYILIAIISVLIVGVLALTIWGVIGNISAKQKANAEFIDLNSNSVVNFNQLVNMSASTNSQVINSYSIKVLSVETGNLTNYDLNISIISGHKYYVNTSTNSIRFIYDNGNGSEFFGHTIINAPTSGTFTYINYNPLYGPISVGEIISCNIIDLTTMFGAGNEPNLEQAQQYFIADYYPYNAGQVMPFSIDYLSGYYAGIKDYQDNLTATYTNNVLGTIAYPLNANGFNSNIAYNAQTNLFYINGIVAIPFGNTISTPVEINIKFYYPNYSGGIYLVFFSRLGGELQPLYITEIVDGNDGFQHASGQFNVVNLDTIYMGCFYSNTNFIPDNVADYYAVDSQLIIKSIDYAALLNAALGQAMSSYQEGGFEYEQIYNLGYNAGYVAQMEGGGGFWDFISVSMQGITSIMALELLPNIPLGTFVLFPLLIGLIFFIVKLTKGGE